MTLAVIDALNNQRNIIPERPINYNTCKKVVRELVHVMRSALVEGRPIGIRGFGILDVRWRKPRTLKISTPGEFTHEAPRWNVFFILTRDMDYKRTARRKCHAKIPRTPLKQLNRLEMINTVKKNLGIHVLDATKYVRAFFYLLPDLCAQGRVEFEDFGVFTGKMTGKNLYIVHFRAAKSLETDMNPHLEPGVRAVRIEADEEEAFMEEHDVY